MGKKPKDGIAGPTPAEPGDEACGEAAGTDVVRASWQRSLDEHRVNPDSGDAPRILTTPELRASRAPVDELVALAAEENDLLYAAVGKVGYAVLFTSPEGVVVDVRGDQGRASEFARWGIWQGGVWGENVEGTNGIGTCIAEQRPITVHRSQHFRARHASLSCCGAPVFDPDGELVAVVDVSSYDPRLSDSSHALALALTMEAARGIEERLFRMRFRAAWVLAIAPASASQPSLLVAVDDEQRIVGADRCARAFFGPERVAAADMPLGQVFEAAPALFQTGSGDRMGRLVRTQNGEVWPVLVTPPEKKVAPRLAHFHDRPRKWHGGADSAPRGDERSRKAPAALSPRERDILQLIAEGRSNKEIARALEISPETVKSHLENAFTKLAVERRAQAVDRAKTLGLVP